MNRQHHSFHRMEGPPTALARVDITQIYTSAAPAPADYRAGGADRPPGAVSAWHKVNLAGREELMLPVRRHETAVSTQGVVRVGAGAGRHS